MTRKAVTPMTTCTIPNQAMARVGPESFLPTSAISPPYAWLPRAIPVRKATSMTAKP